MGITPKLHYDNKIHVTISIGKDDLEQAKQLALFGRTNVSHLLADFIREKWAEKNTKAGCREKQ